MGKIINAFMWFLLVAAFAPGDPIIGPFFGVETAASAEAAAREEDEERPSWLWRKLTPWND